MPTTTITGTVLETADPGSPTLGAGKVVALPQDQSGNPLPKESRLAPVSVTIASGSVSLSLPDAPATVRWLIMVSPAAGTLRPYALASVAPGGTVTTATLRSSRKGGAMLPDAASVEALLASLPVDDARGGSVDIEALTETLSDSFASLDENGDLVIAGVPVGGAVESTGERMLVIGDVTVLFSRTGSLITVEVTGDGSGPGFLPAGSVPEGWRPDRDTDVTYFNQSESGVIYAMTFGADGSVIPFGDFGDPRGCRLIASVESPFPEQPYAGSPF